MNASVRWGALLIAVVAAGCAAPAPISAPGASGPLALDQVKGASWTRALTKVTWPNRDGHASVVFHDRLLGGSLGVETTHDVWSSADGGDWTEVTAEASWPKRHNHAAVVFNGRIWVLGGWGGDAGKDLNDVWSSMDGITWRPATGQAQWLPPNGHTSVVFQNGCGSSAAGATSSAAPASTICGPRAGEGQPPPKTIITQGIGTNFASERRPPKTLITPALFSRPLPSPSPGEEGEQPESVSALRPWDRWRPRQQLALLSCPV